MRMVWRCASPATVMCRIGKGGRAHPHRGIARKAEAFARDHRQRPVGAAIAVLVMQQGNGISARLDIVGSAAPAPAPAGSAQAVAAGIIAAARKARPVSGQAGAQRAALVAQARNLDDNLHPAARGRIGGSRGDDCGGENQGVDRP